MLELDYEKLRQDLIDYFGTGMFNASPLAIIELSRVENASPQELIQIALQNNFDLSNYQSNTKKF